MARAARYAFAGLSAANVGLRWRPLGQWRGFRAWVVDAEKGELKSREAGWNLCNPRGLGHLRPPTSRTNTYQN